MSMDQKRDLQIFSLTLSQLNYPYMCISNICLFAFQTKHQYLNYDVTFSLLQFIYILEVNIKLKLCASLCAREGDNRSRSKFPPEMKKLNGKKDYHYIIFVVRSKTFFINLNITF